MKIIFAFLIILAVPSFSQAEDRKGTHKFECPGRVDRIDIYSGMGYFSKVGAIAIPDVQESEDYLEWNYIAPDPESPENRGDVHCVYGDKFKHEDVTEKILSMPKGLTKCVLDHGYFYCD